jgi:hypothetical protein
MPTATLIAALRRSRGIIVAMAIVGALSAAFLTVAVPSVKNATTTLYLAFPQGTDATQAMPTELSVLATRGVARSALDILGSKNDPAMLLSEYHGTIASNGILQITARGSTGDLARRRADAVAQAFLSYRAQLAQEQLDATVSALKAQQGLLQQTITADDAQINSSPASGGAGSSNWTLVDDSQQRSAQLHQIDATIQQDEVAAQSVAQASRVIDPAYVASVSTKKTIAKNMVTGGLVAIVLASGTVLFVAITTTRLRRRAEIAAALQATVVLSLGPIVPNRWRRLVPVRRKARAKADLANLVAHLERTLALDGTGSLIVVSIDSLKVARRAVLTLADRLHDRGLSVSLVNETPAGLADKRYGVAEDDDDSNVVLVLAVLDPAAGAEHVREWASSVVAIVTAGRSTEEKLRCHATMLRSASLSLSSVVLVNSDPTDATLGVYPLDGSVESRPARDAERSRSAVELR